MGANEEMRKKKRVRIPESNNNKKPYDGKPDR